MLLKPGVATKALAAKKKKVPAPVAPTVTAQGVPNAPPVPIDNTPFTAKGIWDAYNKKMAEANSANLGRYGDILGDLNERYKRNMGYLEGMGASEASDINDAAMQQAANVQQQMTSAGLAGTTVMPTMQAGVERQRLAEQGRLQERLRQQKLAADSQLSGDIASFKERRTDQAPDMGLYAQLAMQMAAGGQGGTPTPGGAPAGGGGIGGPAPGGGAPGGQGLGGMMMSSPYVKETMPLYSNAAGGGSFTKNRPLTDHEKLVLSQGGTVAGYQKPHAYAPMMGGAKRPGLASWVTRRPLRGTFNGMR